MSLAGIIVSENDTFSDRVEFGCKMGGEESGDGFVIVPGLNWGDASFVRGDAPGGVSGDDSFV